MIRSCLALFILLFVQAAQADSPACPNRNAFRLSGAKMAEAICKGVKTKVIETPIEGWFNMCGVGGQDGFAKSWDELQSFAKLGQFLSLEGQFELERKFWAWGARKIDDARTSSASPSAGAVRDPRGTSVALLLLFNRTEDARQMTTAFVADLGHQAALVGSSLACLPWEWKARYICQFVQQVAINGISGDGVLTAGAKAAKIASAVARFENESKLVESLRGLSVEDRMKAAAEAGSPPPATLAAKERVPEVASPRSSSTLTSAAPAIERRGLAATLAPKAARTKARADLIASQLERRVTTPGQNRAWAEAAQMLRPDGTTKFFDVENSVMKKLNDTLRDKNLVTALTNLHKQELIEQLRLLQASNPGLKVLAYSDFKSIRYAFRGKVPPNLEAQLDRAYQIANQKFAQKVEALGVLRKGDDPASWFKAGYGETADRANLAARAARDTKGASSLVSYASPEIRARMEGQLRNVETAREALQANPRLSTLLEESGSKKVPSRETFDLIRKNGNAADLVKAVRARYGLEQFGPSDAEALLAYAKKVDDFSPGIHVINREVVNLDGAVHGGFSVDFLGLGSANQNATAAALTKSPSLDQALVHAREGERDVTATFSSKLGEFRNAVQGIAKCSGDDCVGIAERALTKDDKQALLNRLSQNPQTREVRVGFVGEKVKKAADRTMLSTHAESVEKYLRKNLEGQLPNDRLQSLTFGIDMQSKSLGKGDVQWLAGVSGEPLTPVETTAINKALKKAVADLNSSMKAQGASTLYTAASQ